MRLASLRDRTRALGRCVLVPVVLAFVLLSWIGGVAYAHANLVRSQPAANEVLRTSPSELHLWFSEAPEPRFSSIRLYDRGGRAITSVGPLRPDPTDVTALVAALTSLSPGLYTVVWKTASAVDGHATEGSFAFVIGLDQAPAEGTGATSTAVGQPPAASPAVTAVAVRWLGYLAMSLLLGGFAFFPMVARPAIAHGAATLPPRRRRLYFAKQEQSNLSVASDFLGIIIVPLALGWIFALLTTIGDAGLQASAVGGPDPAGAPGASIGTLLLGTRYGVISLARLLLLLFALGSLLLGQRYVRTRTQPPDWWWAGGLGTCALLLLTTSLRSHGAAEGSVLIGVAADWLHVLAASAWVGGLVALSLTLRRPPALSGGGTIAVGSLVDSFSRYATLCVACLGVTGLVRALAEVPDLGSLFDTSYGTALLIKLGLIIPLLGIAALNLLLIRRRLVRASIAPKPDSATQPWHRRIRQTVGLEVILISAVLLVTSVLTSLPPARDAYGPGLLVRGEAGGVRAVLVANPGTVGPSTFTVLLRDAAGQPIGDAAKVALVFTSLDMDMGETEAVARNTGGGSYSAKGTYLSMSGRWRIQLLVRRPGRDDVRIDLNIEARAQQLP